MKTCHLVISVFLISPLVGVGLDSSDSLLSSRVCASPPVAVELSPPKPDTWPSFRGNQALLGVADVQLPERLELKWTFKTGDAIKSSPVIARHKVFIGSDDGHVYALDAKKKGEKIWAYKTSGDQSVPDEAAPVEAPPLIVDDVLYVGSTDAFLYAIDADTGKLKWRFPTNDRILGSANWALAPDGSGRRILFGSYDNRLYCLDAATGQLKWSYESGYYINGAPAILGNKVVFGGCDEVLHVLNIVDGAKLAEVPIESPIAGSVALIEGRAYLGHYGNRFVAAAIDKAQIQWTYKDKELPYFSSPAVNDQYIVFGGRDRRVHCVKRVDGERVWTFQTGGAVDSSPVICHDKVVVGSEDGRIYLLGLHDGEERWSYEVGASLTASPAVTEGLVVIGAEDGGVYAFGPERTGQQ